MCACYIVSLNSNLNDIDSFVYSFRITLDPYFESTVLTKSIFDALENSNNFISIRSVQVYTKSQLATPFSHLES